MNKDFLLSINLNLICFDSNFEKVTDLIKSFLNDLDDVKGYRLTILDSLSLESIFKDGKEGDVDGESKKDAS